MSANTSEVKEIDRALIDIAANVAQNQYVRAVATRASDLIEILADENSAQSAELASLRARCDAAEKNAERYRWLRDHTLPAWERDENVAPIPRAEIVIYVRRETDGTIQRFRIIGKNSSMGIPLDEAIDHTSMFHAALTAERAKEGEARK